MRLIILKITLLLVKKTMNNENKAAWDKQASTPVAVSDTKTKSKNYSTISVDSDINDGKCQVEHVSPNEHVKNTVGCAYGNMGCIDVAEQSVLIYDMNNDTNYDKFLASVVPNPMRGILMGEVAPKCDCFVKWKQQSDFMFGFVPLLDFVMPVKVQHTEIITCSIEMNKMYLFIYLFRVLRRFQHCTGHITTGSWKGRGNQYIEFARVVYCKLPTNGKQLPAFPLKAITGIEPRPQRWD